MPILVFHALLFMSLAAFLKPPTTANVHNYLSGVGGAVLKETVGTLEMHDGDRFLSNPNGQLKIIVTYGNLAPRILGLAMRGSDTCRIVISHVLNPEISVSYDSDDLRSVLVHEIGHCFGMDHFKDENHVMFWSYDGKPHGYERISKFVRDLKRYRHPLLP
jgi:hypothetical protein